MECDDIISSIPLEIHAYTLKKYASKACYALGIPLGMEAPRYVRGGVHSLGACPAVVIAVAESPRMQWAHDGMGKQRFYR